jgi:excinuclease ABC subunit B
MDTGIRVEFFGDEIERLSEINIVTGTPKRVVSHAVVFPASHYVIASEKIDSAMREIESELEQRIGYFEQNDKLIEAQRIKQRTMYDMEMLRELGFCSGIENYSRVLSGRAPGSTPFTLMDYFFRRIYLLIVGRVRTFTLPQVRGCTREITQGRRAL